jgi:predicted MFS family arabinose efflux permease
MSGASLSGRSPGAGLAVRILAPFAFGYFLSYLFRTVNAVIAPDLTRELGLGADALGLLTSAYLLSFAAAQLPLGILLDRIGPRRTEAALLLVAAAGALIFAVATGLGMLFAGRVLIGLGVSACLMAGFKACVDWFPRERLPFVNGIQMAAGGLGAMAATAPVEVMAGSIGWRGVFLVLAGLCLLAAASIYFVVPRHREDGHASRLSLAASLAGVGRVLTSPLFWRVAPLTVVSEGSFMAIIGLWAGPWLRDVGGHDRVAAAELLLAVAAAMVAGFLLMGLAADRLARFGISSLQVAVAGMSLFAMTLALIVATASGSPLLWLAFGFFGTAGILPYAALSQRFPAALAGRLNTTLNVLVFTMGFAAQWGMGAIIALWPQATPGGYALEGYRTAFAVMLSLQVLGLAWFAGYRGRRVPKA